MESSQQSGTALPRLPTPQLTLGVAPLRIVVGRLDLKMVPAWAGKGWLTWRRRCCLQAGVLPGAAAQPAATGRCGRQLLSAFLPLTLALHPPPCRVGRGRLSCPHEPWPGVAGWLCLRPFVLLLTCSSCDARVDRGLETAEAEKLGKQRAGAAQLPCSVLSSADLRQSAGGAVIT